jgi:hypothetical protein
VLLKLSLLLKKCLLKIGQLPLSEVQKLEKRVKSLFVTIVLLPSLQLQMVLLGSKPLKARSLPKMGR